MSNTQIISDLLKGAGLKVTKIRKEILSIFIKEARPLSAKQIESFISLRNIDTSSIYRNILSLQDKQLIIPVKTINHVVYYEFTGLSHHHHITCLVCGKEEDIYFCEEEKIQKKALAHAKHFRLIQYHTLEFFGVCKSCQR